MLTADEKVAGRWFRSTEQAALADFDSREPATYNVPWYLSLYRHKCERAGGRSVAMTLKEQYVFSPEIHVADGPDGRYAYEADGGEPGGPNVVYIPANRFGFIWKQGKCKCGQTARSSIGQFVDSYERPPAEGRVAR